MTDLITDYADYESFARRWQAKTLDDRCIFLENAQKRGLLNEQDTRQLWQLLGLLGEDNLFIQIPEWLTEEKPRDADGIIPTTFVGHVTWERKMRFFSKILRLCVRSCASHTVYTLSNAA
ncbi:hypothetical protein [Haladaptatus sp. DYF46]|uniref:hypothetical protein n=1 Tax=Haladaptatus sp. DYF46 TaxID=2886041 RepID=UPI001E3BA58D|nr:hypothetical protein [Haladaptatus sp. DYF46]